MKLLSLHCDYIRFKPVKKAIKNPEELSQAREQGEEIKEALVFLTAVESNDSLQTVDEYVANIKDIAGQVKAKRIVLYPYAHLSSDLGKPDLALEILEKADAILQEEGFEVHRAPFGYYKEFELKCKGHPLAELSRSIGQEEKKGKIDIKTGTKIEKPFDLKKGVASLSRVKLDTSKLKENDHRILGQRLDLFSFNEAAPGQPFWHENGLTIFNELIKMLREIHQAAGYKEILTPQILENKVWKVSGHWDLYKENMFITDYEGRDFAVKPMSCPGAMLVYKTKTRSYRDLPLRLSEMGVVHRKELSGTLAGLLRVIRITQDDAHLFCAEDQLESEILNVIQLFKTILDHFGFEYLFTVSVRSDEKKDKYLGEDSLWTSAEKALAGALKKLKLKFETVPGEAKFYGPSLDVVIKDSLGREWQCSTLQLDFNTAKRFELEYIGKDNKTYTPIILHRTVFGSMERFIGILLEHLNGNLPLWLSPVQVRVVNFTERNLKIAEKIFMGLRESIPGLRIDSDFRNSTVNDKIRDAELQKVNYILVVGDKEEQAGTLAVRRRGEKKVAFGVKTEDFIRDLKKQIDERK